MTYDPNASRKGGARKRLVEEVVKQAEYWADRKESFECMRAIYAAVQQYKKDAGK